jgi:hypothetical protein
MAVYKLHLIFVLTLKRSEADRGVIWAKAMMGDFVWAMPIGLSVNKPGFINALTLDALNRIHLTGSFKDPTIYFGPFSLTNADNTGNTSDLFIAKIDSMMVTGTSEFPIENHLSTIYPNPADQYLIIKPGGYPKNSTLTITNLTGRIMYRNSIEGAENLELDLKNFAEGVYLVRIQERGRSVIKKLIISR